MASAVNEKSTTPLAPSTSTSHTIMTEHLKVLMGIASDCFGKVEKPATEKGKEDSLKDRVSLNDTGCIEAVVMTFFGPIIDLMPNCFKARQS